MTERHPLLGPLYSRLMTRADDLAARLVAIIDTAEEHYRLSASVPATDLHRSCRDNILTVLQLLADDVPVDTDALAAPRATGRRRAQQRMPLDAVLHSFRIGGRLVWEELAAEAKKAGDSATDAVLDAASAVWDVVDRVSSVVVESYRDTERELLRADTVRIGAAFEALISGRGRHPGIAAEAARTLGLPGTGDFAVVVAAVGADDPSPLPGVRERLQRSGMASAWHRWPDHEAGIVVLNSSGIADLRAVLATVGHARIGVSGVVHALADVHDGHRQAGSALETVSPTRGGLALLDEVLPSALLLAQPDLGRRLVNVVLGEILALSPPDRDLLLDTIRAWLAAEGSPSATATSLYCHRNTVLNRLRRIEHLIGRSTERTSTRVELALAMTALDVLPTSRPARPELPRLIAG